MDDDFMDEQFVQDFIVECAENLDKLDREFVDLEQRPDCAELLSSIFRTMHNLKGAAALLAFCRLESVTHLAESLLDRLRTGDLVTTPEIIDGLLQVVDLVRQFLANVEGTGSEGAVDTAAVEDRLRTWLDETPAAPSSHGGPDTGPRGVAVPTGREAGEQGGVAVLQHQAAVPAQREGSVDSAAAGTAGDKGIRVDVALLDQLVRLVGELVITRNQIVQHAGDAAGTELPRAAARLDVIASELQEGVMRTRMQPIDNIWSKLPRIVRDVGAQCGKQVRLVLDGKETELDRTLLEAVKDPLTHVVRNAVDHGIETPEVRVAAGKPAEGTLVLHAFHEGGQVVVEARDDGGGIDPARVAAVALDRGLVTQEQLARMHPTEVVELVFRPGFSTAACVTNISGRGVGMDVVRTNIEKIGGTVDLASELGTGTTVRVKIPLTLAIIPALVVSERGERFAIPQVNLLELVRLEGEAKRRVELLAGVPVFRLRGRLLPLVHLDQQLGLASVTDREALNIVVLSADGREFGLVVDEVHDTQEIVVKPLSRQLKRVDLFAGATIMGDGRISLILDVPGIAARTQPCNAQTASARGSAAGPVAEVEPLLVCRVGGGRRVAVPLADVSRIEEVLASAIERAGTAEVVQYRTELLRLVRPEALLGLPPSPPPGVDDDGDELPLTVVVHDRGDRPVGLVVEGIVDVVAEPFAVSGLGRQPGLLGSAVVQDRVTDLLDVSALLAMEEVAGRG